MNGCELVLLLFCTATCIQAENTMPETIYLPYSETEDVDFTISLPSNVGCYQWTSENEEVVELIPVHSNYELLCGTKLELKILPKTADPKGPVTFTVEAENVDVAQEAAQQRLVYTIVVTPVARLEVVAEKTSVKLEDGPVMLGVAAYDSAGNELDTLDGVTLNWFIGANRDIARFHGSQTGPIVHIEPTGGGRATVICVISDPGYSGLEAATLELSVASQLVLEPDGVYLLPGGAASLALQERLGAALQPVPWDTADYTVASREEDIARVDMAARTVYGGSADEETSLLIKDKDGNIVKGVPIRTASPHRMEIRAHPHPESRQLIVGQEYNITTTIYDVDGHEIFPSENIVMKTTFGKQFDVLDITVNGVLARVVPEYVGVAKIRASLRSTLAPDTEEETELEPHVKATTDFEIYESVVMSPTRTLLPWEPATQPEYELTYKVSGGGKVYRYQVQPDTMATADSEGKVRVVTAQLAGPGSFSVTAGMSQSRHNNATARVHLVSPVRLELPEYGVEWQAEQTATVPLAFYTREPDTGEELLYTDCADLDFQVALSNNKDFTVKPKQRRGEHTPAGSCAVVQVVGGQAGSSTKLTVSYKIPGTDTELRQSTHLSVYRSVEAVVPGPGKGGHQPPQVVLPVGASKDVLLQDGPGAWPAKPSGHFREATVLGEEEVVRVQLKGKVEFPNTAATITCLKLGQAEVEVAVGNKPSSTNKKPTIQRKILQVFCSEPGKISKVDINHLNVNHIQIKNPIVNKKTGRIMTYSYRDFNVVSTVKDKEGRTFDNTSSLVFRVSLSDNSAATVGSKPKYPFTFKQGIPSDFKIPLRETIRIHPNGVVGDLDVQVAVVGYDLDVLKSVGAEVPEVGIPDPGEPFSEPEDEDYDYDDDGNFVVLSSNAGITEEISLSLGPDHFIDGVYDQEASKP